jgi:hypothetical protein
VRLPAPIPPNQHLQEIRQLPERPLMRQHPPPINHKPHPKPRIKIYISNHNHRTTHNIEIIIYIQAEQITLRRNTGTSYHKASKRIISPQPLPESKSFTTLSITPVFHRKNP